MSKLGVITALGIVSVAAVATYLHRSQSHLLQENTALHRELTSLQRLSVDNERLSNLVAQANATQANANEQFQELLKLRIEVNRLRQERDASNEVTQAKMLETVTEQLRELAALRSEVSGLGDEISLLREDLQDFSVPSVRATNEERTAASSPTASNTNRSLGIRMIETHPEAFAEKLKRSASAQEGETFQEVFNRFLQANGVDTSSIAAAVFDERTGRVIVRATAPALDAIERVTTALDQAQ